MRTVVVCLMMAGAAMVMAPGLLRAEEYRLHLPQESSLQGQMLPAGEYKVTVDGASATVQRGKTSVSVPVAMETMNEATRRELVFYDKTQGEYRITKFMPKGGTVCLVFGPATEAARR